jgi:hypothetical protein
MAVRLLVVGLIRGMKCEVNSPWGCVRSPPQVVGSHRAGARYSSSEL